MPSNSKRKKKNLVKLPAIPKRVPQSICGLAKMPMVTNSITSESYQTGIKMETLKELENKVILEMGQIIEAQVYGGNTQ